MNKLKPIQIFPESKVKEGSIVRITFENNEPDYVGFYLGKANEVFESKKMDNCFIFGDRPDKERVIGLCKALDIDRNTFIYKISSRAEEQLTPREYEVLH